MDTGALLVWADGSYRAAASYLDAVVIALAILFGGFVIARIVETALGKLLGAIELDAYCARLLGKRRQYARAMRTTVVRILYALTVYLALRSVRLAGVALTLIAWIVVAIILVAITISLIELLPNLIARSRLRARRIGVGDDLEIDHPAGKVIGRVIEMGLLELQIRRSGGDVVFFPHASLVDVRITRRRQKR